MICEYVVLDDILPLMGKRLAAGIIGLGLVFWMPWWAVLAYSIAGSILFSWYAEAIVFGAFFDVMYGTGQGFAITHTVIFAIPLILIEVIKRNVTVTRKIF